MSGYLRIILIAGICLGSFSLTKEALCVFDVSARPYEGGYDLRFGKISSVGPRVNKEIIIDITSDIGKQYRLIQTLLEPLTNVQGISLSQNNFFVYGLRGTNKYGTLSVEQEIPVFLGRTIIYTSSSDGLSDSFTLVYGLQGPFGTPSGSYRGRIAFTLEPIDATQSPVIVILNIFAEIETESSIQIKTATGLKTIGLNSARADKQSCDVLVDIKGSLGGPFKILQSLSESLRSSQGEQLPPEAVNFQVREVKLGSGQTQGTPLSLRQEPIYTSNPRGDPDSFLINYSLGDLSNAKAGRYRTNIKYFLEGIPLIQTKLIDSCDLEVEIERLFDLIIKPESGSGTIEFRDLKPGLLPKTYEVLIEVKTNIGRQYQVTQNVLSGLVSKEGQVIPSKYFTLRTENVDTKGLLKFPQNIEVRMGDTALFVSDSRGLPDSFKIVYELVCPMDVQAGDYSTSVVYSLSEL